MKIKIWKSYGSNHSEVFRIIGKFETVEDASKVEKELEALLGDCYEGEDTQEKETVGVRINTCTGYSVDEIKEFLQQRGAKIKVIDEFGRCQYV